MRRSHTLHFLCCPIIRKSLHLPFFVERFNKNVSPLNYITYSTLHLTLPISLYSLKINTFQDKWRKLYHSVTIATFTYFIGKWNASFFLSSDAIRRSNFVWPKEKMIYVCAKSRQSSIIILIYRFKYSIEYT